MPAATSVDTSREVVVNHAPDDLSGLLEWDHAFPSSELVDTAASMFTGSRIAERVLGVTLLGDFGPDRDVRGNVTASGELTRELFGDTRASSTHLDRAMVEGPRWRVMVSPGTVSVRYQDPVRAERAAERALRAMLARQDNPGEAERAGAPISSWSSRSRSRMVETLAQLDWEPLFASGDVPAMVTLTYPGDWLAVAPVAEAASRHVGLLRKRFARAWGRELVGVWKREFQDRTRRCPDCIARRLRGAGHDHPDSGRAPHWHLLMTPPHGSIDVAAERPRVLTGRPARRPLVGQGDTAARPLVGPKGARTRFIGPLPERRARLIGPMPEEVGRFIGPMPARSVAFPAWLSETWAEVVGAERCTEDSPVSQLAGGGSSGKISCCEFHRHLSAGTGIDYAEGVKARDPKSIGIYFSKHAAFGAKEYQNSAPPEWVEAGTVGRFWGVWGLERAVSGVIITADEATAARRTLRRYSRANSYETRVPVWRYRTVVDYETGEVRARWRRATKKTRVYRVKGQAGYLVVRDGPALASSLARHLDQLYRPGSVVSRSGAGPVGFLP